MVDALVVGLDLGVPEGEADPQPHGLVEQRLGVLVGHLPVVVMVELGDVLDEPAGEEGGHGQLGVHQQLDTLAVRLVEKRHQAVNHLGLRFVAGDGPHLGGADDESS